MVFGRLVVEILRQAQDDPAGHFSSSPAYGGTKASFGGLRTSLDGLGVLRCHSRRWRDKQPGEVDAGGEHCAVWSAAEELGIMDLRRISLELYQSIS